MTQKPEDRQKPRRRTHKEIAKNEAAHAGPEKSPTKNDNGMYEYQGGVAYQATRHKHGG